MSVAPRARFFSFARSPVAAQKFSAPSFFAAIFSATLFSAAIFFSLSFFSRPARADLVRGTIKIDVRDASGATREAKVTVRPEAGGETRAAARAGEVYIADGLLDGNWIVAAEGAPEVTVRVRGRRTVGAVIVFGEKPPRRGKPPAPYTVGPDEPGCDDPAGLVVEAVGFAGEALGAGRLELKRGSKRACSATMAGGGATLRLAPGDYLIEARFVGNHKAVLHYQLRTDRPIAPMVLRAP